MKNEHFKKVELNKKGTLKKSKTREKKWNQEDQENHKIILIQY